MCHVDSLCLKCSALRQVLTSLYIHMVRTYTKIFLYVYATYTLTAVPNVSFEPFLLSREVQQDRDSTRYLPSIA